MIDESQSSSCEEVGGLAAPLIIRQARDFNKEKNIEIGVLPYGDNVIHNKYPYHPAANMVEYDISFSSVADYELAIEYAAKTPRPCKLFWDKELIASAHIGLATGGWEEQYQTFEKQGVVSGGPGVHKLRIEREDVFPHIRTIKLTLING